MEFPCPHHHTIGELNRTIAAEHSYDESSVYSDKMNSLAMDLVRRCFSESSEQLNLEQIAVSIKLEGVVLGDAIVSNQVDRTNSLSCKHCTFGPTADQRTGTVYCGNAVPGDVLENNNTFDIN